MSEKPNNLPMLIQIALDCDKDKEDLKELKKIDYTLAPPEFDDVILVLQHSAESGKYGKHDWLKGINFEPEGNIASIKRHLNDYRLGIRNDKENNLHPMLMVACRALMQYTLDKRGDKS